MAKRHNAAMQPVRQCRQCHLSSPGPSVPWEERDAPWFLPCASSLGTTVGTRAPPLEAQNSPTVPGPDSQLPTKLPWVKQLAWKFRGFGAPWRSSQATTECPNHGRRQAADWQELQMPKPTCLITPVPCRLPNHRLIPASHLVSLSCKKSNQNPP